MIAKLGGRKFIAVMTALLGALAVAFFTPAQYAAPILAAYGTVAAICVAAFCGAHAADDSTRNLRAKP